MVWPSFFSFPHRTGWFHSILFDSDKYGGTTIAGGAWQQSADGIGNIEPSWGGASGAEWRETRKTMLYGHGDRGTNKKKKKYGAVTKKDCRTTSEAQRNLHPSSRRRWKRRRKNCHCFRRCCQDRLRRWSVNIISSKRINWKCYPCEFIWQQGSKNAGSG